MQTQPAINSDVYQALDDWFISVGLSVTPTGIIKSGRKWSGLYNGRHTTVLCSPRTKTKYYGEDISRNLYIGHELTIEMQTAIPTRLSVTLQGSTAFQGIEKFIFARMNMQPVAEAGDQYEPYRIVAHELDWAHNYLSQPDVHASIAFAFEAAVGQAPALSLQPHAASFRMREALGQFTAGRIQQILDALFRLSEIADAQSQPSKIAKKTWFEKMARENPTMLAVSVLAGGCGLLLVATALFIGVLFLGAFTSPLVPLAIFAVVGFVVWRLIKR